MPTCTKASLITNVPQFSGKTLNDKQRLALTVWYKAKELAAIGGTDFTSDLLGTDVASLLYAETQVLLTANDDELKTAMLAIAYNNAVAAGASVSSDPAIFSQNIKCLINAPTPVLQRFLILLECQLGQGEAQ